MFKRHGGYLPPIIGNMFTRNYSTNTIVTRQAFYFILDYLYTKRQMHTTVLLSKASNCWMKTLKSLKFIVLYISLKGKFILTFCHVVLTVDLTARVSQATLAEHDCIFMQLYPLCMYALSIACKLFIWTCFGYLEYVRYDVNLKSFRWFNPAIMLFVFYMCVDSVNI